MADRPLGKELRPENQEHRETKGNEADYIDHPAQAGVQNGT